MDKLKLAHKYAMKHIQEGWDINYDVLVVEAWQYADAMQAEAEKRECKERPDVLKEGQHFDDLTPTWDQGPNVLTTEDAEKYRNMINREFDLYNNPPPKIEKRKSIHAEALYEVDWRVAPKNAFQWQMINNEAYWRIEIMGGLDTEPAPTFGFTGSHIVERPDGF